MDYSKFNLMSLQRHPNEDKPAQTKTKKPNELSDDATFDETTHDAMQCAKDLGQIGKLLADCGEKIALINHGANALTQKEAEKLLVAVYKLSDLLPSLKDKTAEVKNITDDIGYLKRGLPPRAPQEPERSI